jgi:succinate dehydrogenase/fumarate reductase flavoprotein subunit
MDKRMIDTDLLVVGGGGAGFRAAIGAREKGAEVVLLSKGPIARCGATPMAGADFTMDGQSLNGLGFKGDPNDSYEKMFNDIVTQGSYLNNQKLVDQYIRNAPARGRELMEWGIKVVFSEERAIVTSGVGIMDALLGRAKQLGVNMLEDTMMIDLVTRDGRVVGGLGLNIKSGEFVHFKTKAVVIASGGWHKAFWPNTGSRDLSGEGIAMAHRAGADIGNMEFITFACNILLSPPAWKGSITTYVIHLLAGGRLTNREGEDFLEKYDPDLVKTGTTTEWNKSFVSHATMKEVREGKGSPNGGIYYSRGDVPWEEFEPRAKIVFPGWKYKAMDLSELGRIFKSGERVEVGPAVEYFDGGIVVNDRFETSVEGLYAAGECTLGTFGANRVFSAITEMLVHGADAGEHAAEFAKTVGASAKPYPESLEAMEERVLLPLNLEDGVKPAQLRRRVQQMAHSHLGPIRNEKELTAFIHFLEKVRTDELPHLQTTSKTRVYNKEWLDAIELENIVFLLEAAARSALFRTESRGVHFREDYPHTDNENWLLESRAAFKNGTFTVNRHPTTVTGLTPPEGIVPYLEWIKNMMQAHSDTGGLH